MALVAKKSESFEPVKAGTYVGVCYAVIDLGTQKIEYKGAEQMKRQVRFSFELPDETKVFDGIEKPMSLHMTLTLSMNEKSQMYKIVKSWFGNVGDDFDIMTCLGKAGIITAITTDDGKYTNIANVSHLMKGQIAPTQFNQNISFNMEEFDERVYNSFSDKTREKIANSVEYKKLMNTADKVNKDDGIPF